MIREIHTKIRTGRAPRARGRNTMIRNRHTGGYKALGLILGLAVTYFAVGVSAASAQAQECEAGSFRSDPYQCEQPRAIELGVSGSSIEHVIDGAFAFCYTGTLGSLISDGIDQYIVSYNHVLAKENYPDNGLAPWMAVFFGSFRRGIIRFGGSGFCRIRRERAGGFGVAG